MMASVVGTYDMSVCGDCVYWQAYGGTGIDGTPVESDYIRLLAWQGMAQTIGADDLVLGYKDPETGKHCQHDEECYCHEPYFSHRDCDLCGQIAGNRYDVVVTGFKSSKVGA